MSDSLSSERLTPILNFVIIINDIGESAMSQEEILMTSWKEGDILEIYDHIDTPAAVYL
jgi:hypothetical protein